MARMWRMAERLDSPGPCRRCVDWPCIEAIELPKTGVRDEFVLVALCFYLRFDAHPTVTHCRRIGPGPPSCPHLRRR